MSRAERVPRSAKSALLAGLLWLWLASALWLGLQNALAAGALYPGASLRFGLPLSAAQAKAARQYAIQKETGFLPSFWREETQRAQSELYSAEMRSIRYSGEGNAVYPAAYLLGGSPGFTDEGGCALSRQAAWLLWGSGDVLGKEVRVESRRYTVRGVFEGDEALLLLSEGLSTPATGWMAAELWGQQAGPGREQALAFAQTAGLGTPTALVLGGTVGGLMQAAAFLPAVLLALWLLLLLLRALHPFRSIRGQMLVFACLCFLALALPLLLSQLPSTLLPTRWSDFGYWAGLWRQAQDALRQFWAMAPGWRDVLLKERLLWQGLCLLAAIPPALWLGRRFRQGQIPALHSAGS